MISDMFCEFGDFEMVLFYFECVWDLWVENFGLEDFIIFVMFNNFGLVYLGLVWFEDVLNLYEVLVEIKEKSFGRLDGFMLFSMLCLVCIYNVLG